MVIADDDDVGERDRRQFRGVVHGRGDRVLAVRRGRRDRCRTGRGRVVRVRPTSVAHRQRGARGLRLVDDRVPEGRADAVRGPDTAGRRVRCHVHHNTHVRRRDCRTRDPRFLSLPFCHYYKNSYNK